MLEGSYRPVFKSRWKIIGQSQPTSCEPLLLKWAIGALWAHGAHGAHGAHEAHGAQGSHRGPRGPLGPWGPRGPWGPLGTRGPWGPWPMGPRRTGGGRKPCPTSKDYLLLSVLPCSLFCIWCCHHTFKVIFKEISNLLLPSTYFKAGPTFIEWPVMGFNIKY